MSRANISDSRKFKDLLDCGFTSEQIECLDKYFAARPHTHELDEVLGLEDELDQIADAMNMD